MQRGKTVKQCTETGLVLALLALLTGIFSKSEVWLYLSAGLILIALIFPKLYYPFAVIWFGFSAILGLITSRIILYAIFFIVVTPVGLIRRMAGKDRLKLKDFKSGGISAFTVRNHLFVKEDLDHPY